MLKTQTTPVGTAILLEDNIIEVTIHTGIELNREKLLEGYQQLSEMAEGKFSVLVNRTVSDYSVTFDAMESMCTHPDILAQALLIPPYNAQKQMVVEMLINFPRSNDCPLEYFTLRKLALEWLRAHRDNHFSSTDKP